MDGPKVNTVRIQLIDKFCCLFEDLFDTVKKNSIFMRELQQFGTKMLLSSITQT